MVWNSAMFQSISFYPLFWSSVLIGLFLTKFWKDFMIVSDIVDQCLGQVLLEWHQAELVSGRLGQHQPASSWSRKGFQLQLKPLYVIMINVFRCLFLLHFILGSVTIDYYPKKTFLLSYQCFTIKSITLSGFLPQ